MKGRLIFFMLFAAIILYITLFISSAIAENKSAITGKTVTGETITGETTIQSVDLSITVLGVPTLVLANPKNVTYISNTSLFINFSASGHQAVWYNIDNGANTTLSGTSYFNASQGNHYFYLYANNSGGQVTAKNINFSINSSRFFINYSDFNGESKGSSTDFNQFGYEELQNISDIVFENNLYGEINFPNLVNITNTIGSISQIDFNANINLSFNRIALNSSAIPIFNTSATLYLYNLTFSNPIILKDGNACPASICTKEKYLSGSLKFNVTQFSVYSSEEAPPGSTESGEAGSSGGGGSSSGGVIAKKKPVNFKVSSETIKMSLKQGETEKGEIEITNIGEKRIEIGLELFNIENVVELREKKIDLEPGETKKVIIDFIAKKDQAPDVYVGKIKVTSEDEEKEIFVVVDISSKTPLFDVKIEIPERFKSIKPGEDLISNLNLFSLGKLGRVDVNVKYFLKDEYGDIILSDEETAAVETSLNLLKLIKIPDNAKPGKYVLYVKITYDNQIATSSAAFNVVEKSSLTRQELIMYILFGFVIIAAIIIIYQLRSIRPSLKKHINIDENALKGNGQIDFKKRRNTFYSRIFKNI